MLNKLLVIIFAAVMGFALGGSFVWSLQSPHPTIEEQRAETEEHGTQSHTKEKAEEALARYTWWLTAFTGMLALATIGLGVATLGLYLTGEKQVGVARDAADAAQQSAEHIVRVERAYIYGGFGWRAAVPDEKGGTNIVAAVTMANYGKTPGFIKHIWTGKSKLIDLPDQPVYQHKVDILDLYFPSMTMEEVRTTRAAEVVPADGQHVVFQRVVYTDVLGKEHYSGSIYRLFPVQRPDGRIEIGDEVIRPDSAYWDWDEPKRS